MSTQTRSDNKIETISLRGSLLLLLLVPQLLAWLLGSMVAWQVSHNYHEDQLEALMRNQMQVVSRIMQGSQPVAVRLRHAEETLALMDVLEDSTQLRYQISTYGGQILLGNPNLPLPAQALESGKTLFYNGSVGGKMCRILALQVPDKALDKAPDKAPGKQGADIGTETNIDTNAEQGIRILLAKDSQIYYDRADRLARNMLFPLAGLALLYLVLLYFGVRRGLKPLRKLVEEIGGIQNGNMQRVNVKNAPAEIESITNALNHLLDTMSKQVDNEKRFINDAAHQLRTPLAGLISQAELAMGENDPQKLRERIDKMHGAALRSSHLVQQLLSLARSEGKAGRHQGCYDLAALAREVAREWIPKSIVRHIDMGYEGVNIAMVRGDRLLMREAISNLIDNALMYSEESSVVNVSVRRLENQYPPQVVLEVADNGPGVPSEQLPEVFKRFWRANHHIAGGCGLGLPLVGRVTEQHDGVASAHSADPHGFVVRLTIPEAPQAEAAQALDSGFAAVRRGAG